MVLVRSIRRFGQRLGLLLWWGSENQQQEWGTNKKLDLSVVESYYRWFLLLLDWPETELGEHNEVPCHSLSGKGQRALSSVQSW
jgi:hypothetical protein